MCGIFGLLAAGPTNPSVVAACNNAARHRGPDDEGYLTFSRGKVSSFVGADTPFDPADRRDRYSRFPDFADAIIERGDLCLSHRRLSIIDLTSAAHQPMGYRDRYWITYNGEIYNYLEIRNDLEAIGYEFATNSDTEVVLAAYAEWGSQCQLRFVGMWAFAIFDTEMQEVFLSRDRFGIKPLYYSILSDGSFVFSSEIKQFLPHPAWVARLNHQRAYDFLVWATTDHTDETLFSGVYQVPPGSHARCPTSEIQKMGVGGRVPTTKWFVQSDTKFGGGFDEAASKFCDLFSESVRLHLRSDAKLGACLSGGLDSSAIVCVAANALRIEAPDARLETFTSGSETGSRDETGWARVVADAAGTNHHVVIPGREGLFSTLHALTWHQDEPVAGPSLYAQWAVYELAARKGMKVMLGGQGSDEQLAGYNSAFAPLLRSLFQRGNIVALVRELVGIRRQRGLPILHSLQLLLDALLPSIVRQLLRRAAGRAHNKPSWLNFENFDVKPVDPFECNRERTSAGLNEYSKNETFAGHLQMLLHFEDRNSMAHSIESRVPFVEHRVTNFCINLPDEFKIRNGISKRVLREGLRNIVPDNVLDRKDKISFETPEEDWLTLDHADHFRSRVAATVERSKGIISAEAVSYFDSVVAGRRHYNLAPWRMVALGEWMEAFEVQLN